MLPEGASLEAGGVGAELAGAVVGDSDGDMEEGEGLVELGEGGFEDCGEVLGTGVALSVPFWQRPAGK